MSDVPDSPKIGQSAPAGTRVSRPVHAPVDPSHAASGGVGVGRVIEVTVVSVGVAEVEVHLADGRVGTIGRKELDASVAVGDTVVGALLAREDPKGRVVLSAEWASKLLAWEMLEEAERNSSPVTGKVTRSVKGGYVVDVGVRGFLPTSLVSLTRAEGGRGLVGSEIEALVTDVDRSADRVVLSVRDLQRRRRREQERGLLRELQPGSRVRGKIQSIEDFGAIVDLGGLRGLIHRGELTWGRLGEVCDIVAVGDEVEVVVLDVNKSKKRVGLSLRRVHSDPLESVKPGDVESATVVKVVEYGVFMRLDSNGADGLVHMSELSEQPGVRPDQLVVPGEQLTVKVLDVDMKRRRLALSVIRVLTDD